jgi:hypothetical protein
VEELAGWSGAAAGPPGPEPEPAPPELAAAMDHLRAAGHGAAAEARDEPPADEPDAVEFLEPGAPPGFLGKLGPYHVIDVVGRGGMGVVLKAHDPALDRVVAIKVLAPALAVSANARRRFVREARAAAAVSHEHVVTIHAVDEAGAGDVRLPYLVMQFVSGRSLEARLRATGPLKVEEVLRIGMQAAAGLAAAHAQGLVHRDVKPANIMLENGVERVKLTDFGLARAADDASITITGQVTGTPHYMAPEQARGERVDHRADLFSLGSVMYALCTGRPPFGGSTPISTLRNVCEREPVPIARLNEDIPPWLCDLVAALMRKDPSQRPATAAAVAAQLEQHLARLQHPAGRESDAAATARTARLRLRPRVAAAVAVAAVVLVATLIASRSGSPFRPWFGRAGAGTTEAAAASKGASAADPLADAAGRPTTTISPVFTVRNGGGSSAAPQFASLAEAVSAAAPGADIEVDFNGRLETPHVDVGAKPLRIRAANGARPVLVQSAGFEPILSTSAPLVLEGLELVGRTGRPTVFPAGDESGPCLLAASGGPLYVTNCRFVVIGVPRMRAGCIRLDGCPMSVIRNCELHCLRGAAVHWLATPNGASIRLENVIAASRSIIVVQKAAARTATLSVAGSTLYTAALVTAHPSYAPGGLAVDLGANVLVLGAVLFDPEAERKAGRFEDTQVSYRETVVERLVSSDFDAAARAASAAVAADADSTTQTARDEAGALQHAGMLEGRVRFAGDVRSKALRAEAPAAGDFNLQSIRLPGRGNVPTRRLLSLGARTNLVGTGAAYVAFCESVEHQSWHEQANALVARPGTSDSSRH